VWFCARGRRRRRRRWEEFVEWRVCDVGSMSIDVKRFERRFRVVDNETEEGRSLGSTRSLFHVTLTSSPIV
jgi:hypothetical protein